MRCITLVLSVIAFLVATVAAAAAPGTNAERMARGLPPLAPRKLYRERATPVSRTSPFHASVSCVFLLRVPFLCTFLSTACPRL